MPRSVRRNFIALDVHITGKERSKISNLNFHHRKLEREEKIKNKVNRREEIIKKRTETNEAENRKKNRDDQQNQMLVLCKDQ